MDLVPTEKLDGEIAALRSRREALESANALAFKRCSLCFHPAIHKIVMRVPDALS